MGDKMNQEVIDIIIPMYNAEKTIVESDDAKLYIMASDNNR